MKKVFLIGILTISGLTAIAQKLTYGPRVGATYATVHFFSDDREFAKMINDGRQYMPGMQVGVALNIKKSDRFSFQPELHFAQLGDKAEYKQSSLQGNDVPVYNIEQKSSFRRNYLHMPLLAKFTFGSENFKFFVNAGPSINYFISGKIKNEGSYTEGEEFHSYKNERKVKFGSHPDGAFNRLDMGPVGGFGVGMPVGSGIATFDVRFQQSFTSIGGSLISDEMGTNRFFSAGIGYLFSK